MEPVEVEWRSCRPEKAFRAALFLSAVFHVVVVLWVNFPVCRIPSRIGAGNDALIVQLTGKSGTGAQDSQVEFISNELRFELISPAPAVGPEIPVVDYQGRGSDPSTEDEESSKVAEAAPATPGQQQPTAAIFIDHRESVVKPGRATVFLSIDEAGKVVKIIWDSLPVVSKEELMQMEAELLEKPYTGTGSPYSVAETVIVPRFRESISTTDP